MTPLHRILLVFTFLLSSAGSWEAWPIGLALVPSTVTVASNDPVEVGIVISGTAAGIAPSIGAYDLQIGYDASLFEVTSVSFGGFLGHPEFETLNEARLDTPGVATIAAVSLLPAGDLDALQPDAFLLATIAFVALADGTAAFTFLGDLRVDDAFGTKLPVPEPGPWALMLVGLAFALSVRAMPVLRRGRPG